MSKTFFGKLLQEIENVFGAIFSGLLGAAKQAYDNLPSDVQNALQHGSGILSVINSDLTAVPADVIASIQAKFPDVNVKDLQAGLFKIVHTFGLAADENSLEDIIVKLQTYLSSVKGSEWEGISSMAAQILSIFFAPAGTQFGKIVMLIEYVYQRFFRK